MLEAIPDTGVELADRGGFDIDDDAYATVVDAIIQDEIGQAVAEALALKLLPARTGGGQARAVHRALARQLGQQAARLVGLDCRERFVQPACLGQQHGSLGQQGLQISQHLGWCAGTERCQRFPQSLHLGQQGLQVLQGFGRAADAGQHTGQQTLAA